MNTRDWMKLISLSLKELAEAVDAYAKAKEKAEKDGKPWAISWYTERHYTKEAIKRRITQIRQDLLLLEKEL